MITRSQLLRFSLREAWGEIIYRYVAPCSLMLGIPAALLYVFIYTVATGGTDLYTFLVRFLMSWLIVSTTSVFICLLFLTVMNYWHITRKFDPSQTAKTKQRKNMKQETKWQMAIAAITAIVTGILFYRECDEKYTPSALIFFIVPAMFCATMIVSLIIAAILQVIINPSFTIKFNKKQMCKKEMNTNDLMLFREISSPEFDFDSMLQSKSYSLICGAPVKIDRVMRDLTGTTVLGVSGTMSIRGVRIRGVWDAYGNIVECKKTLELTSPRSLFANVSRLMDGVTEPMLQLVNVKQLTE